MDPRVWIHQRAPLVARLGFYSRLGFCSTSDRNCVMWGEWDSVAWAGVRGVRTRGQALEAWCGHHHPHSAECWVLWMTHIVICCWMTHMQTNMLRRYLRVDLGACYLADAQAPGC